MRFNRDKKISRGTYIQAAARAAVVGAAGIAGMGTRADAGTFVWDAGGSPDNNWNTPTNWAGDTGFPVAGDSAQWNTGTSPGSSTVALSAGGASASDLQVDNVAVTFNLNSFALTVADVGIIDGDAAHATFNGPGSVTFGSTLKLGVNRPFSAGTVGQSRVTAQGGATVDTTALGMALGAYRGGGIVTVDGAGTVWNNARDTYFGLGQGDTGWIYTQPRAQLIVTNGAHFNHNLGANQYNTFVVSKNDKTDSRIVVDGPGSQLNITGSYGYNFKVGGYNANSNWEITNGGLMTATVNLGLSFANGGTGVNTYTISGTGSKMTAPQIGIALRTSDDPAARGATLVNVGTGGTLEGTSTDGSDRSIAVGSQGRLALQGGTVSVPVAGEVVLRDTGIPSAPATLTGNGTITGGGAASVAALRVQGGSVVRPGASTGSGTGTLTIANGNFIVESTSAKLEFDLSTTNGAHDRIQVSAPGKSATVPGVISYANIGSGADASGILDFLRADSIIYSGFATGDIPAGTDNLDTVLTSAGYTTRVFNTPAAPGEYRYFIAPDVVGSLDALRLQLFTSAGPTVATWSAPGAGSWLTGTNWSGGIPNAVGAEAKFLGAIGANSTIYADSPVTVGTMRFNNAASSYHITGAASLTLEVASGSALVEVTAGSHKINLPLIIASNTDLSVSSGATLKISDPVTVNAGKSVSETGTGTVTYESTVTLLSGSSLSFSSSQHVAALTVGDNGTATVQPNGSRVLEADSLSVSSTAGKVDLKNNKMIFRGQGAGSWNGSAYTGASGLVRAGRVSSSMPDALSGKTALAVATAGDVGKTTFGGQSVNPSDGLIMYTYAGDANLDGKLNGDDYFRIDSNVGTSSPNWSKGDFNYDGKINGDDYFLLDRTIGLQSGVFPSSEGFVGGGITPVPEPVSLGALGLGAAVIVGRRRRRRNG